MVHEEKDSVLLRSAVRKASMRLHPRGGAIKKLLFGQKLNPSTKGLEPFLSFPPLNTKDNSYHARHDSGGA